MTRILRRLTVAAAVPAALLLAGCGTPQSGAAAVVGERRIAVSDVQDAYRDVTVLIGQDAGATQTDMLEFLILEPYLVDAAAKVGIGVSTWNAEEEFKEVEDKLPNPSPAALSVARGLIAVNRLQGGELPPDRVEQVFQDIIAKVKAAKVQINPRYGSGYNYDRLEVRSEAANWLKVPSPTASPAVPGQGGTGDPGTGEPGTQPGTEQQPPTPPGTEQQPPTPPGTEPQPGTQPPGVAPTP